MNIKYNGGMKLEIRKDNFDRILSCNESIFGVDSEFRKGIIKFRVFLGFNISGFFLGVGDIVLLFFGFFKFS